jgi:hypothetical protein
LVLLGPSLDIFELVFSLLIGVYALLILMDGLPFCFTLVDVSEHMGGNIQVGETSEYHRW